MEFDEDQVNDLAQALFADAVKPGQDGITVDDLSDQFKKHKGLLENLTLSIGSPMIKSVFFYQDIIREVVSSS